ncbi:hypothetical protein ACTA71_000742 [Dictyostelium dimigraforme]
MIIRGGLLGSTKKSKSKIHQPINQQRPSSQNHKQPQPRSQQQRQQRQQQRQQTTPRTTMEKEKRKKKRGIRNDNNNINPQPVEFDENNPNAIILSRQRCKSISNPSDFGLNPPSNVHIPTTSSQQQQPIGNGGLASNLSSVMSLCHQHPRVIQLLHPIIRCDPKLSLDYLYKGTKILNNNFPQSLKVTTKSNTTSPS